MLSSRNVIVAPLLWHGKGEREGGHSVRATGVRTQRQRMISDATTHGQVLSDVHQYADHNMPTTKTILPP
jgi:hypothetical protein